MTKKLSTIMAAVLLICVIISISCVPVFAATNASDGYISYLDLSGGFHQGAEREYEFDNFEISMHAVELYNISWLPEIQCRVELGYLSYFLWIEMDFIEESSTILSFFAEGETAYHDFGYVGLENSSKKVFTFDFWFDGTQNGGGYFDPIYMNSYDVRS